mgnify:CR=1 FL=1
MALTFVIIGDVIPPRDRGKYQGYFGGVWGLSSVAEPLLDQADPALLTEAVAVLAATLLRTRHARPGRAFLALSFSVPVLVGYGYLLLRGARLGTNASYDAYKLLSVFYSRRRHNIREPGVPEMELEKIFGCKIESLEFHLWYLKAKHWIEMLDNGMLSITVEGIGTLTNPVVAG